MKVLHSLDALQQFQATPKKKKGAIHSLDLWMRTVCAHLKWRQREKKQHLNCNRKWKQFSLFVRLQFGAAIAGIFFLFLSLRFFAHFIWNDNKAHLGKESLNNKKITPNKSQDNPAFNIFIFRFSLPIWIWMWKCGLSFHFNPAIKYICSWILYGLRNITLTINECEMERE